MYDVSSTKRQQKNRNNLKVQIYKSLNNLSPQQIVFNKADCAIEKIYIFIHKVSSKLSSRRAKLILHLFDYDLKHPQFLQEKGKNLQYLDESFNFLKQKEMKFKSFFFLKHFPKPWEIHTHTHTHDNQRLLKKC